MSGFSTQSLNQPVWREVRIPLIGVERFTGEVFDQIRGKSAYIQRVDLPCSIKFGDGVEGATPAFPGLQIVGEFSGVTLVHNRYIGDFGTYPVSRNSEIVFLVCETPSNYVTSACVGLVNNVYSPSTAHISDDTAIYDITNSAKHLDAVKVSGSLRCLYNNLAIVPLTATLSLSLYDPSTLLKIKDVWVAPLQFKLPGAANFETLAYADHVVPLKGFVPLPTLNDKVLSYIEIAFQGGVVTANNGRSIRMSGIVNRQA